MLSAAAVVVAVIAACSVPGEGGFQPIGAADVDFGLAETTTTAPPTTRVPATTVFATTTTTPATTSTIVETTTTAGPQTEQVDLYFVLGSRLTKITQPLISPAPPELVIRRLLSGPPTDGLGDGLRTLLPVVEDTGGVETPVEDLPIRVTVERGIAQVTVPASFSEIGDEGQLAFGQIVLSLYRPGIGGVVFYVDGAPIQVIIGDGSLTEAGQPVTVEDYENLVRS